MDSDQLSQIFLLLLLLLLSAFFSSAETALTTANRLRMRSRAEQGDRRAKTVLELTGDSARMLSAILIGNNIVNLSASSLTTTFVIRTYGSYAVGIATGIITFLVIMFGEIIPKSIASHYPDRLSLIYAGPVKAFCIFLTPLIWFTNHFSILFQRLFGFNPNRKKAPITENELRTLVDVSHEAGVIESDERRMITNVVDFGDSLAKDVMIPRIDMECIDVDADYAEVMSVFRRDKYTRLPVYQDSRDKIIGILNFKDLLLNEPVNPAFSVRAYMREPYFTYEFKKTSTLLLEMRKRSVSICIVLDEYGVTAGMITLEDLIEEIIGDIHDEYDNDEDDDIKKISAREYLVRGSTKLDEIEERIGLSIDSEDYDSIAGHVIELLDHLPVRGESVSDEKASYTVEETEKNRIDLIRICLKPEAQS